MRTIKRLNQKGVAIIETMITLTVLSILTVAATGVFSTSQNSLDWNYHALSLQKELRKMLYSMSQEIRESSPSSPMGIRTANNTISFQIPSTVAADTITAWRDITYSLVGNNAVRIVGGQTTVLGTDVQSMTFTYPVSVSEPRTVQIQITGTRKTLKRTITVTVTNRVVLRN